MTWKNEYNQNRKEYLTEKQRQRRQKLKSQQSINPADHSKYYNAAAFKILLSFKEYTELNKSKKKLWLDFNWTLQDCQASIQEGLADVVAIMKLEQVANNLIHDYWTTAKSEVKKRASSWNNLDYDKQQRLIRYWGQQKARVENNFLTELERQERQGKQYEQQIELAKFHEERGKLKCDCYSCSERSVIQKEIKSKIFGYQSETKIKSKEQCPQCGKNVKELDFENGICQNCLAQYE